MMDKKALGDLRQKIVWLREDREKLENSLFRPSEGSQMTSEERILLALSHKEPDQVPFDLGSTIVGNIRDKWVASVDNSVPRRSGPQVPLLAGKISIYKKIRKLKNKARREVRSR